MMVADGELPDLTDADSDALLRLQEQGPVYPAEHFTAEQRQWMDENDFFAPRTRKELASIAYRTGGCDNPLGERDCIRTLDETGYPVCGPLTQAELCSHYSPAAKAWLMAKVLPKFDPLRDKITAAVMMRYLNGERKIAQFPTLGVLFSFPAIPDLQEEWSTHVRGKLEELAQTDALAAYILLLEMSRFRSVKEFPLAGILEELKRRTRVEIALHASNNPGELARFVFGHYFEDHGFDWLMDILFAGEDAVVPTMLVREGHHFGREQLNLLCEKLDTKTHWRTVLYVIHKRADALNAEILNAWCMSPLPEIREKISRVLKNPPMSVWNKLNLPHAPVSDEVYKSLLSASDDTLYTAEEQRHILTRTVLVPVSAPSSRPFAVPLPRMPLRPR